MVNAVQIDERSGGWEASNPTFRVILYSGGDVETSWAVDTWDLSDCGVLDAIRWAQDHVEPAGAWAVGLIGTITYPPPIGETSGFTYLEGFDLNDNCERLSPWESDQLRTMVVRGDAAVIHEA